LFAIWAGMTAMVLGLLQLVQANGGKLLQSTEFTLSQTVDL
jgi:hypothetical protein